MIFLFQGCTLRFQGCILRFHVKLPGCNQSEIPFRTDHLAMRCWLSGKSLIDCHNSKWINHILSINLFRDEPTSCIHQAKRDTGAFNKNWNNEFLPLSQVLTITHCCVVLCCVPSFSGPMRAWILAIRFSARRSNKPHIETHRTSGNSPFPLGPWDERYIKYIHLHLNNKNQPITKRKYIYIYYIPYTWIRNFQAWRLHGMNIFAMYHL